MSSGLRWPGQTIMGSWPPAKEKKRSLTSIQTCHTHTHVKKHHRGKTCRFLPGHERKKQCRPTRGPHRTLIVIFSSFSSIFSLDLFSLDLLRVQGSTKDMLPPHFCWIDHWDLFKTTTTAKHDYNVKSRIYSPQYPLRMVPDVWQHI